ncbi:three component ABC system middle component [Mucilaginibacter boryungensis]|uniref:Uncharacterized protein n=1 Tax=Mucilaginibacter boryungensis TaxID=768480 RepID=A0ABR9XDG3_9SPHI|nr:three component ABC system middle component [Mucilaginibacter boryungensis]MBE9665432.1 hypothetical protein [Mucilaginibacter boryungensis]
MLNEFDIFQNKVLGAHVIWEFSKNFKLNNKEHAAPSLLMTMPVIPLCFNKRVVVGIKERNFREGSLLRALEERKDLFSGLQERMEGMADLTLQSVYLGSVSKLFYYDRENAIIVPIAKGLPAKVKESVIKNYEYNDIINASRRIGAWFGLFNQSEIMLYFNLRF